MRLFVCLLALAYLPFISGCPATDLARDVHGSINATGTAVDKAAAFTAAAEQGSQAAKPYADVTGKALLDQVSKYHGSAQSELSDAKADLKTASDKVDAMSNQVAALAAQVDSLARSWGHILQVWVTRIFWVLIVLLAIHTIAILITPFLPPPYSNIAAGVGKWVNPLGWTTMLLSWMQRNAQLRAESPDKRIAQELPRRIA